MLSIRRVTLRSRLVCPRAGDFGRSSAHFLECRNLPKRDSRGRDAGVFPIAMSQERFDRHIPENPFEERRLKDAKHDLEFESPPLRRVGR